MASADPAALGGGGGRGQTYRILNSVVGSSKLDSVLLTEGNILDPSYEI